MIQRLQGVQSVNVRITEKARSGTELRLVDERAARGIPDFRGKRGEVTVRYEGKRTLVLAGLGGADPIRASDLRVAAAAGMRRVCALRRTSCSLRIPASAGQVPYGWQAGLEGALLGPYRFEKYKPVQQRQREPKTLELVAGGARATAARRVRAVCEAVNYARDLVNDNAGRITPARLATEARRLGRAAGLKVGVLAGRELAKQRLGLIRAVGQGSPTPPRVVTMLYRGAPRAAELTALIGKGVTFDSGGANLKPTGHIEAMRADMAGAAAVLGTMQALARLRPRKNVLGAFAAVHNALDGRSFFPGDIYASHAGLTVEICSTDAEGRLILADAISYCRKKYRPTRIIDLATLTGGVLGAFGDLVAGLCSNNDELADMLFSAGERTRERLWRLPLYAEYEQAMRSARADLRNVSKLKKGHASTITGAAFLARFVGNTPWAHIDIAGLAYNEREPRGVVPRFATGFGIRLLVEYLTGMAEGAE